LDGGLGDTMGSSMSSAGVDSGAGAESSFASREASIRHGRLGPDKHHQHHQHDPPSGVMSGSYQSTYNAHTSHSHSSHNPSHSASNDNSNNASIRVGSAAAQSFENRTTDGSHHATGSLADLQYGDEESRDESEGVGTAQEAIQFHQNHKALEKYLDGQHCFDEICTELEISERELTARLKRVPWVIHIIHR
jgi:hypothetical protein